MSALVVWMNGEFVGTWSVGRTGNHRLDYAPSWRASARSRPLSLSLPFTADNRLEGDVVRNYFDNLLPDSDGIRKRISARFHTKGTDAFALLQAVGRDCVGAVQLLPPGVTPNDFDQLRYEALTPEQIEKHLGALGSQAGVGAQDEEEGWRLSIAGAQEKTALLQVNGQWCRPLGATPTSHILKPPIGVSRHVWRYLKWVRLFMKTGETFCAPSCCFGIWRPSGHACGRLVRVFFCPKNHSLKPAFSYMHNYSAVKNKAPETKKPPKPLI